MKPSAIDRFLTEFAVPQEVRIRSKWLRVPEIIIDVLLVSVFVMYRYVYMLGFCEIMDTRGRVCILDTGVYAPGTGTCWEVSGACPYFVPEATKYDYCAQHGGRVAEPLDPTSMNSTCGLVWPCVNPRWRSVTFSRSGIGVTLATSIAFENGTQAYITAAEHMHVLKVMARVPTDAGQAPLNLYQTSGAFQFAGEEKPRRFSYKAMQGQTNREYPGWTSNKTCGGIQGDSVSAHECCTSSYATYFTLGVLMEAAGVSMNDESVIGSVRQFGTQLDLNIHFTNVDDFWSWPIGFKPRYTVQVERARFVEGGLSPEERYRAFWLNDDNVTEEIMARGVSVTPQVTAHLAAFEPLVAVTKLTIATVIMGFTKVFVSRILTFVYRRCLDLQHVSVLHDIAKTETSLADHEVKDLLANSDHGKVDRRHMFDMTVRTSELQRAPVGSLEMIAAETAE